jgi:hypothetical protein
MVEINLKIKVSPKDLRLLQFLCGQGAQFEVLLQTPFSTTTAFSILLLFDFS